MMGGVPSPRRSSYTWANGKILLKVAINLCSLLTVCFPPIFPFFTSTYCNYIWSGPACQSLRGKEAEARNATRQPAPCLMSFTGSTKIFFWYRECRTCFFSSQVSGELCWQCLARVDIVSLVNLSYQNKVTDRRNIEKRWQITKAKLWVAKPL